MEYDDIPTYSATRVDPDEPEPTGIFDLRDCFDFRPTVENIAGASTTLSDIDQITETLLTSFIDSMMELVHQL